MSPLGRRPCLSQHALPLPYPYPSLLACLPAAGLSQHALPLPACLQAVETQVNFEKLQEESHKLNVRHREIRSLYEEGRRLRAKVGAPAASGFCCVYIFIIFSSVPSFVFLLCSPLLCFSSVLLCGLSACGLLLLLLLNQSCLRVGAQSGEQRPHNGGRCLRAGVCVCDGGGGGGGGGAAAGASSGWHRHCRPFMSAPLLPYPHPP